MSSWMLAKLKRETQYLLVVANNDRLHPVTAMPSVEGYRGYLSRIYGFEAPVEAALARTPEIGELLALRDRSWLRLLRSDLAALGIPDSSSLATCAAVPVFATPIEAMGWLYTIEHGTIVHGQVHRHLERHLLHPLAHAGSYLATTARDAGARLARLGSALDWLARDPASAQPLIDAAAAALRCQHRWFASLHHPVVDGRPTRAA